MPFSTRVVLWEKYHGNISVKLPAAKNPSQEHGICSTPLWNPMSGCGATTFFTYHRRLHFPFPVPLLLPLVPFPVDFSDKILNGEWSLNRDSNFAWLMFIRFTSAKYSSTSWRSIRLLLLCRVYQVNRISWKFRKIQIYVFNSYSLSTSLLFTWLLLTPILQW